MTSKTSYTPVEEIREAFRHARIRPYSERLEACPDSFDLSATGDQYASAYVEADFRLFASGYRAALAKAEGREL